VRTQSCLNLNTKKNLAQKPLAHGDVFAGSDWGVALFMQARWLTYAAASTWRLTNAKPRTGLVWLPQVAGLQFLDNVRLPTNQRHPSQLHIPNPRAHTSTSTRPANNYRTREHHLHGTWKQQNWFRRQRWPNGCSRAVAQAAPGSHSSSSYFWVC